LTAREFDLTRFFDEEGYNQLVVLRQVPFASVCGHHALPFLGTATCPTRSRPTDLRLGVLPPPVALSQRLEALRSGLHKRRARAGRCGRAGRGGAQRPQASPEEALVRHTSRGEYVV